MSQASGQQGTNGVNGTHNGIYNGRNDAARIEAIWIKEEVLRLELCSSADTIKAQGQDIDWRCLEMNMRSYDMGSGVLQRLYQWYDANLAILLRDERNTEAINVWKEFDPAFIEEWLRPICLDFRQGIIMLIDLVRAFRVHDDERQDQSLRSVVEEHYRNILQEHNTRRSTPFIFCLPSNRASWDVKFVALRDAFCNPGHMMLYKYVLASEKSQFLCEHMRDANLWNPALCVSGQSI